MGSQATPQGPAVINIRTQFVHSSVLLTWPQRTRPFCRWGRNFSTLPPPDCQEENDHEGLPTEEASISTSC
jgi:hypothetical protein